MSDEKIFQEIKGVFSWIEEKKKSDKKATLANDKLRPDEKTYNQLKEFLQFLNVDATHEEIEALNELANPDEEDEITFENFYKVFVKSEQELEKENADLKKAFQLLTQGSNQKYIKIDKLEEVLNLYDKKYKNSMEKILTEIEASKALRDKKLYYEEYIDEQFPLKKK